MIEFARMFSVFSITAIIDNTFFYGLREHRAVKHVIYVDDVEQKSVIRYCI